MTPPKWYEDIWVTVSFTPFHWRLGATFERQWRQATVYAGPFWVAVGWPEISKQTA